MGWKGVLVKDSKSSSTLVCSAPFCSPCGEALVRLKNVGLVGASKSFAQGQDLIRRRGLNFICFWTTWTYIKSSLLKQLLYCPVCFKIQPIDVEGAKLDMGWGLGWWFCFLEGLGLEEVPLVSDGLLLVLGRTEGEPIH